MLQCVEMTTASVLYVTGKNEPWGSDIRERKIYL